MVPSFKNTALIFPEISFTQLLPLFQLQYYDIITDLILHNVKCARFLLLPVSKEAKI